MPKKLSDNMIRNIIIGAVTTLFAAALAGLWTSREDIVELKVKIDRLEKDMSGVLWDAYGIAREKK